MVAPVAFFHAVDNMFPVQAATSVYSCLTATANHYRDQNPKLFALYHKVQSIFVFVEGALTAFEWAVMLERQFELFSASHALTQYAIYGSIGLTSGVVLLAYACITIVNEKLCLKSIQEELQNKIPANLAGLHISVSPTLEEKFQQFFYLTRLISSLAFSVLSVRSVIGYAIGAVSLGYSFWKTSQQKWIHFDYTFTHPHPTHSCCDSCCTWKRANHRPSNCALSFSHYSRSTCGAR